MKNATKFVTLVCTVLFLASCKKDKIDSCSSCDGPNVDQSFKVCEEDGKLFVDGEEIANPNNLTLDQMVQRLEDNITNDDRFVGLSCN